MKPITIGTKEYRLIENLFDINDERFNVFKQYFLQTLEGMDKPLFAATFSKYIAFVNAGKHSDGIIEWHNFKKAIELKELNYDAYSFCFALLCLNKDEDQKDCSEATQLRKLEELRKEGLTRGMVEDSVINFMKASPNQFGVYLQMLEMMRPEISEDVLKR